MLKQLTNFWNRLIPYCWEETLSGQQFIMGRRWWREVRRQTLLQEMSANRPITLFIDEAEKFFSKSKDTEMGFMPALKWAGIPGHGKTFQPAQ